MHFHFLKTSTSTSTQLHTSNPPLKSAYILHAWEGKGGEREGGRLTLVRSMSGTALQDQWLRHTSGRARRGDYFFNRVTKESVWVKEWDVKKPGCAPPSCTLTHRRDSDSPGGAQAGKSSQPHPHAHAHAHPKSRRGSCGNEGSDGNSLPHGTSDQTASRGVVSYSERERERESSLHPASPPPPVSE
jgi:hypothetical protein